jgi:mannose-6-phosphate isomerase-like protein (cupin superfamily)
MVVPVGQAQEAMMADFETTILGPESDVIAPDGSEVRLLLQLPRGSMAHFTLAPGLISKAIAHRTIEEIWYFVAGRGRMWRRLGERSEIVEVSAGTATTIPTGTHFQFRADGDEPLAAIGVTMPPWPGTDEAYEVKGAWEPTVP